MTFDVTAHVFRAQEHRWQNWHEVFAVCRNCDRPTIFLISMSLEARSRSEKLSHQLSEQPSAIMDVKGSLNTCFTVERHIGLRDTATVLPPEHLPANIAAAFKEGAACLSIGCHNAASTMFRLCLDLATRSLLPDPSNTAQEQPNSKQRRDLGLRLHWLFEKRLLPEALRELAKCVREDANDGAHDGSLKKVDAEDLMDFASVLLERLYTEPKRLELAEARRKQRRKS